MARVPAVGRHRPLEDRRDGQDRRALLLLQGDPEGAPRAARVVPAGRARVRLHEHRAGRLRGRRDGPHRPPARARRAGLPPDGLQVAALGRGPQHLRQGRARAAHGHPHRQAPDRRAAQGRRLAAAAAAGAQGRARARSWPTSGSPRRSSAIVGFTAQFDTRDSERALAGTGIEVPPLDSYAERIWDYWERELDPDLYKDRSFEARHQRAHGRHHRRVERHRPRGGA